MNNRQALCFLVFWLNTEQLSKEQEILPIDKKAGTIDSFLHYDSSLNYSSDPNTELIDFMKLVSNDKTVDLYSSKS